MFEIKGYSELVNMFTPEEGLSFLAMKVNQTYIIRLDIRW